MELKLKRCYVELIIDRFGSAPRISNSENPFVPMLRFCARYYQICDNPKLKFGYELRKILLQDFYQILSNFNFVLLRSCNKFSGDI